MLHIYACNGYNSRVDRNETEYLHVLHLVCLFVFLITIGYIPHYHYYIIIKYVHSLIESMTFTFQC